MSESEIYFLDATTLAGRIRRREVSVREVVEAHLGQIERVNPRVNAIVTLLPEKALRSADSADAALARGDEVGPLHGLPVAHKDLALTRGVRTTFGSLVYKDFVPDRDSLATTIDPRLDCSGRQLAHIDFELSSIGVRALHLIYR